MRHLKPIAIVLGIIVALITLSLVFSLGDSEPRNRKIAEDLLVLRHQWDTNITNIPSLCKSLTNLPLQGHGVLVGRGEVTHQHNFLGIKWEERYFIVQPLSATNTAEWRACHSWYWLRPSGGKKELTTRELVTITNE